MPCAKVHGNISKHPFLKCSCHRLNFFWKEMTVSLIVKVPLQPWKDRLWVCSLCVYVCMYFCVCLLLKKCAGWHTNDSHLPWQKMKALLQHLPFCQRKNAWLAPRFYSSFKYTAMRWPVWYQRPTWPFPTAWQSAIKILLLGGFVFMKLIPLILSCKHGSCNWQ